MREIAVSSRARAQRALCSPSKQCLLRRVVDQIEDHALGHVVAAKPPLRSMVTADDTDSDSACDAATAAVCVRCAQRFSGVTKAARAVLPACLRGSRRSGRRRKSVTVARYCAIQTRASTRMLRCAGGADDARDEEIGTLTTPISALFSNVSNVSNGHNGSNRIKIEKCLH